MFTITTELAPTATVVRLDGELDLATVTQVRTHLMALVESGHARLVLDLSQLGFIDSTGIGMVVGIANALGDGQSLALAGPTPRVAKVLALTGLSRLIEVHDSVALASPPA